MKAINEQHLKDPLNIEKVNEMCGYCFKCGYIGYKENLIESGIDETNRQLYICEDCALELTR